MGIHKYLTILVMACVVLTSCDSKKEVVYLQGSEFLGEVLNPHSYSAKIKRDDQLSIIVNSKVPELAQPFNMMLSQRVFSGGSNTVSNYSGGTPQVFWVDQNGDINYPTIGRYHVEGMTRLELAHEIEDYLQENGFIQEPIVNVTFNNHKISVLGEVNRGGQFAMTNERVTIFDAIAMAGDLTIFGERTNVKVLREENGIVKTFIIDLTKANVLQHECYYLQQNDVVYVEPNNTKANNREVSSLYSFGISLTSLALTIATFIRAF